MNVEHFCLHDSDVEDGTVVSCMGTFRRLRTGGCALIIPRLITHTITASPAKFMHKVS